MELAQRAHQLVCTFLAAAPFFMTATLGVTLAGPLAGAQPVLDMDVSGEIDWVAASASRNAPRSGPYGDARFTLSGEHIRDDGVRIGLVLGVRARNDSGRRGTARPAGDCPPGLDDCPVAGGLAPAGLFSGLYAASVMDAAGPRAGLETASVYVRAQLWEAELGYGAGAAVQEATALPGAMRLMRADGPLVDPSGRNFVSTANTLSGHAPKLTVRSRRLIGLRFAASYTPDGDACLVTVCRLSPVPGALAAASPEHIVEGAVSFEHRFAQSGTRWRAFVTAAHGSVTGEFASGYRDPWVVSGGVQREQGAWAVGASALASNDGFAGARYRAQAVSASYERGDWLFSAELGQAQSSLVHARSRSALIAASRYFETGFVLGFGWSHTEAVLPLPDGPVRARARDAGSQVFLEAGLRF